MLLIHPPSSWRLDREKAPAISSYYIGYGMLHVAAHVQDRGYPVKVLNLEREFRLGLKTEDLKKQLKDVSFVGIEMNWLNFSKGALETARIIKEANPNVPVILGGVHASIFSADIIQNYSDIIDGVLTGEAEKTFPQLLDIWEKKESIKNIGGLVRFENNKIVETPFKKQDLFEMDKILPYTFKVVRDMKGNQIKPSEGSVAFINTNRGQCPYNCVYCIGRKTETVTGRCGFVTHSVEWIIKQIESLIDEGFQQISFQDELFVEKKNILENLLKEIRKYGIHERVISFGITSLPGHLNKTTIQSLSEANFTHIHYGIESGSDKVLQAMKRPYSIDIVIDSLKETIKNGVIPLTYWMTGLPEETPLDIEMTSDLIKKSIEIGSIPKWVTPLIVLPKTDLYEHSSKYGIRVRLKTFNDFLVFSGLERKAISSYPETITHETQYLTAKQILDASLKLKLIIYSNKSRIINNFMISYANNIIKNHPKLNVELLANLLKQTLDGILMSYY